MGIKLLVVRAWPSSLPTVKNLRIVNLALEKP